MYLKKRIINEQADLQRRTFCKGLALSAATALAPTAFASQRNSPVVEIGPGRIRGYEDGGVKVFKGTPNGADTTTTRFRLPAAPDPWPGIRDATGFGAQAPQEPRPASGPRALLESWAIPQAQSEDCLFLNVWTPGIRDNRKRPVMLWIHGGGFVSGSGARTVYDGVRLAQRGDVIVVTVNHRLNVFGYLYLAEFADDLADSGNVGQHDLIAALSWVRENIAEFGGDPANVTVFGESGGGAKICTLLAMEGAKGLFHRAVIQSGPMIWASDPNAATETATRALAVLGIRRANIDRLRSVTTRELLGALARIREQGLFRTLSPVLDGRGLTRHPFSPGAAPASADIPVLIGYTSTESRFLTGRDPTNFELEWETLPDRLRPHLSGADVDHVIADYRDLMPDASASDIFFEVTSQVLMVRNATLVADRKAAQRAAPVYLYELTFETQVDGGKWRSPHTIDIPLVFDNVAKSASMFGDTPNVQTVADAMSNSWIAFARSGNPNTANLPEWPEYDATRPTMQFNVESKVARNPARLQAEILSDVRYWDLTKPTDL
jgi:para-nitrobenzyl esterase